MLFDDLMSLMSLQYYMTSFIDSCLGSKIRLSQKFKSTLQFQQFFEASPMKLKRKLTKLSINSYCISFSSKKYHSKIEYFTILDICQSHINIKIVPCDSAGNYIRSKETFNKNGWIRKHINENKNKFLKVNPLTGEVFFIYSCFISEKLRINKFWKQILQKISIVEGQLPQLLSKIINLQGKQKQMIFIQQVIETKKLVFTIKLAEMLKQNVKIQDQFANINPETISGVRSNDGYSVKQSLLKYAIHSKLLKQKSHHRATLNSIFSDFISHRRLIENASCTLGKPNSSILTLTGEDAQKLRSKLKHLNFRQQFRFKLQQFNKELFIMVRKEDSETVRKVKRVLRELGSQVGYRFLDSYLEQNVFDDVLITVATKEISLTDYLLRNFQTISYETKFRILVQTLNAVVTLWMKNQITFQKLTINNFTIDKTLTVKLKKLQFAKHIHPSKLQSQQALMINNQKKQILKEFSNIYFQIFFNRKGVGICSKRPWMQSQSQYTVDDLIFGSLNQMTKLYYPNNLFTLIIGLNYFFIKQYFHNIQKNQHLSHNKPNLSLHQGISSLSNEIPQFGTGANIEKSNIQKRLEHQKRLYQAKTGGPRVDLILAMCIQFLEEHQVKYSQKGGEL